MDRAIEVVVSLMVLAAFFAFPALLLAEALGGVADSLDRLRSRGRLKELTPEQLRERHIESLERQVRGPVKQYLTPEQQRVWDEYDEQHKKGTQ